MLTFLLEVSIKLTMITLYDCWNRPHSLLLNFIPLETHSISLPTQDLNVQHLLSSPENKRQNLKRKNTSTEALLVQTIKVRLGLISRTVSQCQCESGLRYGILVSEEAAMWNVDNRIVSCYFIWHAEFSHLWWERETLP